MRAEPSLGYCLSSHPLRLTVPPRPARPGRPSATVLVLVLVLIGAAVAEAQTVAEDKAALEAIYDATGGAQWTRGANWKTSSPLNEWEDVQTNADGRVENLWLDFNNLVGSLPSALWNLTELKQLFLGGNPMLTGSIPAQVGNLSKLESFSTEESTMLTGEIPAALGNLSQLKYLLLQKNSLSGSIPASLGSLTNLIQLHLNDNSLSGTIPAELEGLTSLTRLELQNNALTEIPAELGNLTELVYLYLHSNQLSGEIPEELGQLTKLIQVQLQDNTDLTGVIPFDARQTALAILRVSNTDLCALPTLHASWEAAGIDYDGQACTTPLAERTFLESLYDSLDGANWGDSTNWKSATEPPATWYGVETNEAGRVTGLSLPNNGLAGVIPAGLEALTGLKTLDLSGNALTGVIPAALEALTRLRHVDLSGNTLTGGIPSWLGDLEVLAYLDLSDNTLTGNIPVSFTQSALDTLDVSGTTVCMRPDLDFQNWLDAPGIVYRGDHRCERTDRTALVALYYATGGPSWTRQGNYWLSDRPLNEWAGVGVNASDDPDPDRVTFVHISAFGLKGRIPREVGDLEFLKSLVLETDELLTGPLPRELGKLTRLEFLGVSQTGLTGPIPTELQQLPQLVVLQIDGTNLCVPRSTAFRTWLEGVIDPPGPITLKTCPGGGGGGGGGTPRTSTPSAVRNLTAAGGNGEVVLTWDAPSSDGGAEITDYEYRINGSGPWISTGSTETTHTVTGLDNGTPYVFEVRAVNRRGRGRVSNRNRAEATPDVFTLDFAHFANGEGLTSDLVFVNVGTHPIRPALSFYDKGGNLIAAESVVEITGDLEVTEDGALSTWTEMEPLGELTISTHGRGELVSGSVRVVSDGPIGGFLRFDLPGIGVAGVGASSSVRDVLFPARRQAGGIRTAAALHNLGEEAMGVNCHLMSAGVALEAVEIPLEANGQTSWFIEDVFTMTDTSGFAGSVRCTAPGRGRFTAIAVEMDAAGGIFIPVPVVEVNRGRAEATTLDFAHFANGAGIVSEMVFVNLETQPSRPAPTPFHTDILPSRPAIYFYDTEGALVTAESVVDLTEDLEVTEDGALTVQTELEPLGVLTISTHGRGELVSGSVRVVSDGPIGGFLRFDLPGIGVAGVGASSSVRDALFPARRQADGISTAAAIHNLGEEAMGVSCQLMQGGIVLEEAEIYLEANGQEARYIEEWFTGTDTSDFVGLVRCTAPEGGMFTGVAVELDAGNRIFTTLPVVPVPERMSQE